jgi:superfamily II DNA/RNA helicase
LLSCQIHFGRRSPTRMQNEIGHGRFIEPTPIQANAIPHLLAGRDLLGIAPTGTDKTAVRPAAVATPDRRFHPSRRFRHTRSRPNANARVVAADRTTRAPRKRALLGRLLADPAMLRVIVFTRTKRGTNQVPDAPDTGGVRVAALHGNKSQSARQKALDQFRTGRASGVAISFCDDTQQGALRIIERMTGTRLQIAGGSAPARLPSIAKVAMMHQESAR